MPTLISPCGGGGAAGNPPTYYADGWGGSAVIGAASDVTIGFGAINRPDGWFERGTFGGGGYTLDAPADLAQAISWHWLRVKLRRTDFGAVDPTKIRAYIWEPVAGQVFSACTSYDISKSLVLASSFGADVSGGVLQTYSPRLVNDDAANSYTLVGVEMRGFRYYYAV